MINLFRLVFTAIIVAFSISVFAQKKVHPDARYAEAEILNAKANGFKGIWYMNQPSNDIYVYKYSGGLGTYCAKHRPFAIYSEEAHKTYFCFGGTDSLNSTLYHNVSYYDHQTGKIANPTIILDKHTTDAHDNPVISMDDKGFIWIFSTAHGTGRPSYITKSVAPYDISKFELVKATEIIDDEEVPFDNFSYFQVWYVEGKGFMALFTKYNGWGNRVIGFNTSRDGAHWNEWKVIANIDQGHYQVSCEKNGKVGVAFNYHPEGKGLNYRTNLYCLETNDFGETWQTASGEKVQLPLTGINNPAIVNDFKSEGLNCYMKDINFDNDGKPVIMVVSSKGYQSGPENNPRTWELFSYTDKWNRYPVTNSDNNYDSGSLYIEPDGKWRIIGPTIVGPQAFNPGGEISVWLNQDKGKSWSMANQLTCNSTQNHNYIRRPVNVHADFYGIWADGHGRKPSASSIYFCNKDGDVFVLPRDTKNEMVTPIRIQINKRDSFEN